MLLISYGIFRTNFLDINDLIFQKNGLFYILSGVLSFAFLGIATLISFNLSPPDYINSLVPL